MTYFLISLTNKCNKSCGYCVVKPWRNNPEYLDKITAAGLIAFLEKELQPGDVVELTGGEPTLFPDLAMLLDWLREHGAKAIVRTNGLRLGAWRKGYANLMVVLARHDSSDGYMAERKEHLLPHDLVLDGIPEDIRQKEQDKPVFKNNETSPLDSYPFKKAFFIVPDGKIKYMPCCREDMGTIWDCKPRDYFCCPKCPYMLGAWNLAQKIENQ